MVFAKNHIIAHRGWWELPTKKNTPAAFIKAFTAGFGVETDIRDLDGTLVIAHDMPTVKSAPTTVAQFLECYCQHTQQHAVQPTLALNIKCDSLHAPLLALLTQYNITNYFVFDMSIPDMRNYLRDGMKTFTRWSDIEPEPLLLPHCDGIWVDAFESDWVEFPLVLPQTEPNALSQKSICLVSPELHRRTTYKTTWQHWKQQLTQPHLNNTTTPKTLLLCTDFPQEACLFFNQ